MIYSTLELEHHAQHTTVWLNRPELRNAFNETMIAELTQVFKQLSMQESVRVIVLAARGKAFCAGADLNWMKKMAHYSYAENQADAAHLATMLHTIYACPKPTLARVQGDCYAGGMGLVSACDMAIVIDSAEFCLSEVRLGLIPATISPYVMRAMGERAARRYFLSAEKMSAQQAAQIGYVHEVVTAAQLDDATHTLLNTLLNNSPQAMHSAKRLIDGVAGRVIDEALLTETTQWIADSRSSAEGKEGVAAFLEKRQPSWLNAQK